MTDLQELLDDIDVADFLDYEAISYRRVGAGTNLNIRECPFCGSSNWKTYMRADNGRGLCFRGDCQAKFSLFSFTRQHLNADNKATAEHIKQYALQAGSVSARPKIEHDPVTDGWELPSSIPLPTPDGQTHPSLIKRRITLDTQALYGLRWCEEGRWTYKDIDGVQRAQIFDRRIIIPVHDLDGVVRSFQGRDGTGKAEKRYLFPSGLPGTGRFLYGGHLVSGKSHLVIGEGPFDTMAIHQAISNHPDFRNVGAVGSFGLSIGISEGDDQLARLLKLKQAGTSTLTFLWDGERGAFLAAVANGEKLLSHGFRVRIGLLPADHDPNEVDTVVVRKAIEEAQELTPMQALAFRLNPAY